MDIEIKNFATVEDACSKIESQCRDLCYHKNEEINDIHYKISQAWDSTGTDKESVMNELSSLTGSMENLGSTLTQFVNIIRNYSEQTQATSNKSISEV